MEVEYTNPMGCPFCGDNPRSAILEEAEITGVKMDLYKVCCLNKSCPIKPSTYLYGSCEQAYKAWNKRAAI